MSSRTLPITVRPEPSAGALPVRLLAPGMPWPAGLAEDRPVLETGGPQDTLLVAMRDEHLRDAASLRRLGSRVASGVHGVVAAVEGLAGVAAGDPSRAMAVVVGMAAAGYRFERYRSTTDRRAPLAAIEVVTSGEPEADAVLAEAVRLAEPVIEALATARDLVNEPPSTLTPEVLARLAAEIAGRAGFEAEVLDVPALEAAGCGGILGIGRGSAHNPPRLVVLRRRPPAAVARVALVGKGITFDSGGLFIKSPSSMSGMKGDMAAAAAIIGAIGVADRVAPSVEIHACLALAENMPGELAIKPGDIVRTRNGRTIEVNDPDAEGRVVLADALAMASEVEPDLLVDLATLTGTKIEALGNGLAAVYATDDALALRLAGSGARAGEPVWRMPLVDAYRPAMDSPVADLHAFDTTPKCPDSILAALFLREFVSPGIPWAHVDMAGCELADRHADVPEGMATGFGAALLVELLRGLES